MKLPVALFVIAAIASLSGKAPAPVEASPIVVGSPPGEIAALQLEIESLRTELAQAKSVQRDPLVVPAPAPRAPATKATSHVAERSGGAAAPVAYYQRRAVYGRFGRFQGYETVQVSQAQPQAYRGNCAGGNCSTGPRWRR